MTNKYIRTEKGLFDSLYHYDETGKLIGWSDPGLFPDSYNHFTPEDGFVGTSDPGIISDAVHYTADGSYAGASVAGLLGVVHFDENGYAGASYTDDFGADTYFD